MCCRSKHEKEQEYIRTILLHHNENNLSIIFEFKWKQNLVKKFSRSGQYPKIFRRTNQASTETVCLRKICSQRKLGEKTWILRG